MNRLSAYVAMGILGTLMFLFVVVPRVHAETIASFDVEITVSEDGSFKVTEDILYDFGDAERHGIYRTILREHPQAASKWYLERYVSIEVNEVTSDGAPVLYDVSNSGTDVEIKIGDPDVTITGQHQYRIKYTVSGGLFKDDRLTELYWNATGNGWQVPIESTRVVVSGPEGALDDAKWCYVGVLGSTESCTISEEVAETVAYSASGLAPGEGLTIAQSLNADVVNASVQERIPVVWVLLVGGVLIIMIGAFGAYRIRTRHKIHAPIIAQYEPYEGVLPMYAGTLIDGALHPHDITAGIVYLAEQGFLKITRKEKKFLFFDMSDYEIQLQKDGATPSVFLTQVLTLLFGASPSVGQSVTLSEIKKNLPQQRLNQKILQELRSALAEDMKHEGYFENTLTGRFSSGRIITALIAILLVGAAISFQLSVVILVLGAIAVLALLIGMMVIWTRRTRKGYEAQNHLKGFKLFLSVTDADRFAFHNAPKKSPETFLAYLPYAIAFGVEKQWADVFRDISIPNPAWYDGGATGAFHAAAFTSDMSTFSSSLASSTGSSPSSGGGSSGGGSGGGGGGSW